MIFYFCDSGQIFLCYLLLCISCSRILNITLVPLIPHFFGVSLPIQELITHEHCCQPVIILVFVNNFDTSVLVSFWLTTELSTEETMLCVCVYMYQWSPSHPSRNVLGLALAHMLLSYFSEGCLTSPTKIIKTIN